MTASAETVTAEIKLDPAGYADRDLFRRVHDRLSQLEEQCEKMPFEECVDRMKARQWAVYQRAPSDTITNAFTIITERTEKGVRYFLALLELYELMLEAEDVKDLEQVPPAASVAIDGAPKVEDAAAKCYDALRYVDICAAALDSSRDNPRNEVMITLENDVVGALTEALGALGYPRFQGGVE